MPKSMPMIVMAITETGEQRIMKDIKIAIEVSYKSKKIFITIFL
jgi:hypothetical protein